jgi:hypothetical protein
MSKKDIQSAGVDKNVGLITLLICLADKDKRETIGKLLFNFHSRFREDPQYNTLWWKRLSFITNILADIAIVVAVALLLTLAGPAAPAILLPLAIGTFAAGSSSRAVTSFTNNLDKVEFRKYNWPANLLILAGAALTVASLFFPPLLPVLLGCAAAAYICGIGINQFGANQYTKLQADKKTAQGARNSSTNSEESITDETHLTTSQNSTASMMEGLDVSNHSFNFIEDDPEVNSTQTGNQLENLDPNQHDEHDEHDEHNEHDDFRSIKKSFGHGSNE